MKLSVFEGQLRLASSAVRLPLDFAPAAPLGDTLEWHRGVRQWLRQRRPQPGCNPRLLQLVAIVSPVRIGDGANQEAMVTAGWQNGEETLVSHPPMVTMDPEKVLVVLKAKVVTETVQDCCVVLLRALWHKSLMFVTPGGT
jgi:hypothetical protein